MTDVVAIRTFRRNHSLAVRPTLGATRFALPFRANTRRSINGSTILFRKRVDEAVAELLLRPSETLAIPGQFRILLPDGMTCERGRRRGNFEIRRRSRCS